jgi:holo-ACP synthase
MSFARSRSSLLAARDRREKILGRHLRDNASPALYSFDNLSSSANRSSPSTLTSTATLFVSLNLPGLRKIRPGTATLFRWALGRLARAFPSLTNLRTGRDVLGPYAILGTDCSARAAKRICVRIEAARPFARLVDIDVYDGAGRQVDRAALGLRARRCLACDRPAAECMRLRRHEAGRIEGIAHELLASCRN